MNNLISCKVDNTTKMSSKEIATLTGKQHKTVLRDIKNMIKVLYQDGNNMYHCNFEEVKDSRGYYVEILLNKELTYTFITGYSIPIRNKIVSRWLELEDQPQQSTSVALTISDKKTNALIELGLQKEVAPMIALKLIEHEEMETRLNNIDDMTDRTITSFTATEIGKSLGFRSTIAFNIFLNDIGIQYKLRGCWFLCADYTDKNWVVYRDFDIVKTNGDVVKSKQMEWTEYAKESLNLLCKQHKVGKYEETDYMIEF